MIKYDLLLKRLQDTLKDNIYCEDGELYIKGSFKYDIYNILVEEDKKYMKKLYKELEYKESE